jgi:hypothetical protein
VWPRQLPAMDLSHWEVTGMAGPCVTLNLAAEAEGSKAVVNLENVTWMRTAASGSSTLIHLTGGDPDSTYIEVRESLNDAITMIREAHREPPKLARMPTAGPVMGAAKLRGAR